MKRIEMAKVSQRKLRVPAWQHDKYGMWFAEVLLELPRFWYVSAAEQVGFVEALNTARFEEFSSVRRPGDKLLHTSVVLRKHVAVAWKVFALLDSESGKLSRRFADLFLRYLAAQYDTRGSLNDEQHRRNKLVLRLQLRTTRFLISQYFHSPHLPRLSGQEVKYFVGRLAELLERCNDDEPLRLLGVGLVFEISSCLEACARALYEDTVRKSGLNESEWALFNSVFSGLIEGETAQFVTIGPRDKLGRTMHYLWAMSYTSEESQRQRGASKSVSATATQAAFLETVRESLQGYRRAIRISAFRGKFGNREACLLR